MLREHGTDLSIPLTIQTLLAARIDQLPRSEREALERGAVEGQVFHRGAVQALAPEEPALASHLAGLVRKELIWPAASQLPGDDAFRFRHQLIRDAAYEALSKATRAELHERFAGWIARARSRPRRAGRDPRLPPRAGGALRGRARRPVTGGRRTRHDAPRCGRRAGTRAQRLPRRREPARPRSLAPRARRSPARPAAPVARRGRVRNRRVRPLARGHGGGGRPGREAG